MIVKNIIEGNIEDLCQVCVPPAKKDHPDWVKGAGEKRQWAVEMLQKWGSFAKVAYTDDIPIGMIQYTPIPEKRIVSIDCIYVPRDKYWRKGAATQLFSSLIEDMKEPLIYFDNKRALALVTIAFHGEEPGQYSAYDFFKGEGFKQAGEDPDCLYLPLKPGFVYQPVTKKDVVYVPQEEDRRQGLLICGPTGCPGTYPYFLKRMEKYIREVDSKVPIRWLDSSKNMEKVKERQITTGDCIVNARHIKSFVLDKKSFQKEVRVALEAG